MKRLHNLAEKRNIRWEGDTDFGSDWVSVPKEYMGGNADSHKTTLAYITDKERDHLKKKDMHGTGIDKEDHYGPSDVISYDGTGGQGGHGGGGGGNGGGPSGGDYGGAGGGPGGDTSGGTGGDSSGGNNGGNLGGDNHDGEGTGAGIGIGHSHGAVADGIAAAAARGELGEKTKGLFAKAFNSIPGVKAFKGLVSLGKGVVDTADLASRAFGTSPPAPTSSPNSIGFGDDSDPTSDPVGDTTSNPSTDRSNNDPDNRGGGNGGRNTLASLITNPTQSMTNVPSEDGDGSSVDDVFAMPMTDLITKRYRRLATLRYKNKKVA